MLIGSGSSNYIPLPLKSRAISPHTAIKLKHKIKSLRVLSHFNIISVIKALQLQSKRLPLISLRAVQQVETGSGRNIDYVK